MRRHVPSGVLPAILILITIIVASSVEGADSGIDPRQESSSTPPGVARVLTLEEAVDMALARSPALAAEASAVAAAASRVTQAGLLPNPELALDVEGFGGDLRGPSSAERTAVLSQPLPLGGTRARRRSVAEAERALAGSGYEAVRQDVVAEVRAAFAGVLVAQQRLEMAQEIHVLAESFARTVRARVDAGKVSPVEATRAGIEVSRASIRREASRRELEAARRRLAALWGSDAPRFGRVLGELPGPDDLPSRETLLAMLPQAPELRLAEDEVRRREQVLRLERALAVPDLAVSAGPRRLGSTGESTWVAGLSLEIPLFDRNQGSRAAAEHELEGARRDAEARRVALEAELDATLERLQALALEVRTMEREIVPAALSAFAATETGYREGKLGFLDVLDAQRALSEARSLLLDSRAAYAAQLTRAERLAGGFAGVPHPASGPAGAVNGGAR